MTKPCKCKVCGAEYTKTRPLQNWCSIECAVILGQQALAKKKAKEQAKDRKETRAKPSTTKRDELAHKSKLAGLGCMACLRIHGLHDPGLVELHHLRGGGWGKGDYKTLIPLCVEHHRGMTGIHGMGVKGFDKHYSAAHGFTQQDLLNDALRMTQ